MNTNLSPVFRNFGVEYFWNTMEEYFEQIYNLDMNF